MCAHCLLSKNDGLKMSCLGCIDLGAERLSAGCTGLHCLLLLQNAAILELATLPPQTSAISFLSISLSKILLSESDCGVIHFICFWSLNLES
jgi:hypothetical protein